MHQITTVKVVKSSGTSLALYLTRELSILGIGKDDKIKVTLEKTE